MCSVAITGQRRSNGNRDQPLNQLAVYTPALENGYFYDSELQNKKTSYGSNQYTPKNYNNVYTGKMPLPEALANSVNAPAVWLLNKIGVNKGYDSVKKFGLPVTKSDKNLALALGGLSKGVSPQELAGAYTAFANNGTRTDTHYIRKSWMSGNVIVDNPKVSTHKVMTPKVAKQMTSMMLGYSTVELVLMPSHMGIQWPVKRVVLKLMIRETVMPPVINGSWVTRPMLS